MPNDHQAIIDEQRHEEQVDQTNVALILANAYFSLNQYVGQREGCEIANIMGASIAGLVASTLQITQPEAEVLLWGFASEQANVLVGRRNTVFGIVSNNDPR